MGEMIAPYSDDYQSQLVSPLKSNSQHRRITPSRDYSNVIQRSSKKHSIISIDSLIQDLSLYNFTPDQNQKKLISQQSTNARNILRSQYKSNQKQRPGSIFDTSDLGEIKNSFDQLIRKLKLHYGNQKVVKFQQYVNSNEFIKGLADANPQSKFKQSSVITVIQVNIKNMFGINLTLDEVQTLVNQMQPKTVFGNFERKSLDERRFLFTDAQYKSVQKDSQSTGDYNQKSTGASSVIDSVSFVSKQSTSLSRPFTCVSYVSSSTAGTSLTKKLERMNRTTLKLLAKQFINCRQQIEQQLGQFNFDLKTKLTPSELVMLLQQTDLSSVTLSSFKDLLTVVLFLQQTDGITLSFKSLLKACQLYIDQQDIENCDAFNTSKLTKIMDEIKDYVYLNKSDVKNFFVKFTECGPQDDYEKVVMTREHFLKFVKCLVSDKYSTREIEQVYRNLVSKKPMNFKRFKKYVTHGNIPEGWVDVGMRQLREFMKRKMIDVETTFIRFLQALGLSENGKISKKQWMETLKRENIHFNCLQTECLFSRIDMNEDGMLDLKDWISAFQNDSINPIQLIREIVQRHNLTGDDLLYRMKIRGNDQPLHFNAFRDCMKRIDVSLTQSQIKNIFNHLAQKIEGREPGVPVSILIQNMTGDPQEGANMRQQVMKKISDHITAKKEHFNRLQAKFQQFDRDNDGYIDPKDLFNIIANLKLSIKSRDIDNYLQSLPKDFRNRINYQKVLLKFENPKKNFPLKEMSIRFAIFLKQNSLNAQKLTEKLIQTKNQSKTNIERGRAESNSISINFFAKFIKAKVDKKRDFEQIKEFVKTIDIDQDGCIGISDLEAFVGRANFQSYLDNKNISTIKLSGNQKPSSAQLETIKQLENKIKEMTLQNDEAKNYTDLSSPEMLFTIVKKVRDAMNHKNLRYPDLFNILDPDHQGLISFSSFSINIDSLLQLSQTSKELLFSNLDTLQIGLVSYDQIKSLFNLDDVGIRVFSKQERVIDNFVWEQNILKRILDWMISSRLSLEQAFKIIDKDFDGILSIDDIKTFLKGQLNINVNTQARQVERLFKVMDYSKTGGIYLVDFEKLFSKMLNGHEIDWEQSCKEQINKYMQDKFFSIDDAYKNIIFANEQSSRKPDQRMRIVDFLNFISSNDVLRGFNLTKDLLYKLFAGMDSHKKGYLTLTDWKNAFKSFDNLDGMFVDFKRSLGASFNSIDEAYNFMLKISDSEDINFSGFTKTLNQIIPKRLSKSQTEAIWKKFSQDKEFVSFSQFFDVLRDVVFRAQASQQQTVARHLSRSNSDTQIDKVLSTSANHFSDGIIMSDQDSMRVTLQKLGPKQSTFASISMIIDKLRRILKTREIKVKDLFEGRSITNIVEFKNVIKQLGIAPKEIDRIYESVTTQDQSGNVDLDLLQKKIDRLESDQVQVERRESERIKGLKELIIKHMNSFQDAFYMFDASNKGKLTFQDFQNLITHIYESCEGKPTPNQPLLRDIFDQLDLKQDGLLDLSEWMHSFTVDKTLVKEEFLFGEQIQDTGRAKGFPIPTTYTKEYIELLGRIAKNRKPLLLSYNSLDKDKTGQIEYDLGVAVFLKYIRETLNLSVDQYPDQYFANMIKPFGAIYRGQMCLQHKEFTETLRNRHFLTRQATNNKLAQIPKEIITYAF